MRPRNGSTRYYRIERQAALERDGRVCQIGLPGCTVDAHHADHIIPRSQGGPDHRDNLRAACESCNLARGDGTRGPRFLTGRRTPPPPVSSLSPRDTERTRHVELPR